MWWPANHDEYLYFINLHKGFFERRITLLFEKWTLGSNSKEKTYECCDSWIKIFGLPWNLWTVSTFELIGDHCGGLLDIHDATKSFSDLSAALIKVKGRQGGFANSELNIQLKDDLLSIRIEVVTVDVQAYEHDERQSYAQAVINGSRRRVGWGNSICGREQEVGGVTNSKVQLVQPEKSEGSQEYMNRE